jgi:quinol-cytochrome oxidoreductase complex cytochrome b subunit
MDEDFKARVEQTNFLWRNRRRMAWGAFFSILIVTALCVFWVDVDRLNALESVLTWFFTAMAAIVTAYMGAATWAGINEPSPVDEGSSSTPDSPEEEPARKPGRRKQARRFPRGSE